MNKEKVRFKDFSPDNKMLVSFFYGAVALMAVMTGYNFKYSKDGGGLFLIGTGAMTAGAVTSHVLAKKEARERLRKEKERN